MEFFVVLFVTFIALYGTVRPFIIEAFRIPSEHMVPTLEAGDRFFVNKFLYYFQGPERYDIVVFKSDEGSTEGGQKDSTKCIVGVPGDEISVQDGVLLINGERQEEPYGEQRPPDSSSFGPVTVPRGEVFVMGHNPTDAHDSRFFGTVPFENIEGKAFVIFWPLSHIKPL